METSEQTVVSETINDSCLPVKLERNLRMKESNLSKIIHDAIQVAKGYSFKDNNQKLAIKNKLRSSIFVESIAEGLYKNCKNADILNVIRINKEEERRIKKGEPLHDHSEFMLDITIEECDSYRNFIWAVESESQYKESAFRRDFLKLIYVRSRNYLYLNGLESKDQETKDKDIQNRLKEALSILRKSSISDQDHNFYFSFFPYPGKPQNSEVDETILNELDLSLVDTVKQNNDGVYDITFDDIICGKYVHLDTIETYKYMGDKFKLISKYPLDE